MEPAQELAVREKQELAGKEEKTVPGRFYVPAADVYETAESLAVVMEMPGVSREQIDVSLEDDVLSVEGRIDFSKYSGLEPLYTEYNVGHYARAFTLGEQVDRDKITAELADGVLTLTVPKLAAAAPRRIAIT